MKTAGWRRRDRAAWLAGRRARGCSDALGQLLAGQARTECRARSARLDRTGRAPWIQRRGVCGHRHHDRRSRSSSARNGSSQILVGGLVHRQRQLGLDVRPNLPRGRGSRQRLAAPSQKRPTSLLERGPEVPREERLSQRPQRLAERGARNWRGIFRDGLFEGGAAGPGGGLRYGSRSSKTYRRN